MIVHSLTEASWEVVTSVCSSSQARLLTWWSRCASGERERLLLEYRLLLPHTPQTRKMGQAVPNPKDPEDRTRTAAHQNPFPLLGVWWWVAAGLLPRHCWLLGLSGIQDTRTVLISKNVPWEAELPLPLGWGYRFLFMHKLMRLHKLQRIKGRGTQGGGPPDLPSGRGALGATGFRWVSCPPSPPCLLRWSPAPLPFP